MANPANLVLLNETLQGTGTVNGTSRRVAPAHAVGYLDVTAIGGTPTLDVDLEGFDAASGQWFTIGSFAQATIVSNERVTFDPLLDSPIRAVGVVAGGTPTVTYTVSVTVKAER